MLSQTLSSKSVKKLTQHAKYLLFTWIENEILTLKFLQFELKITLAVSAVATKKPKSVYYSGSNVFLLNEKSSSFTSSWARACVLLKRERMPVEARHPFSASQAALLSSGLERALSWFVIEKASKSPETIISPWINVHYIGFLETTWMNLK